MASDYKANSSWRLFLHGRGVLITLFLLGLFLPQVYGLSIRETPQLFLHNNTFDGFFVVGEQVDPLDLEAAITIAQNVRKEINPLNVSTQKQIYELGSQGNALKVAGNTASHDTSISRITPFLDQDDLTLLRPGTWDTSTHSFMYTQLFIFNDQQKGNATGAVLFTTHEEETDFFLFFSRGKPVARYSMQFNSPAISEVSGEKLVDFVDSSWEMFGTEYTLIDAVRSAQNSISLTMLQAATEDRLKIHEKKSFSYNGGEMVLELAFVNDDEVQFVVNREQSKKVREGEAIKLAPDVYLAVQNILFQGFAGGEQSVFFVIGSDLLYLHDADITDQEGISFVRRNGEQFESTKVVIEGSDNEATFTINTIDFIFLAKDDLYIPVGGSLRTEVGSEHFFPGNWDLIFADATESSAHNLHLKALDNRYILRLFDGNNNPVQLPIAFAEKKHDLSVGKESHSLERQKQQRLILQETESIEVNDYFVVTGDSAADDSARSSLLQYLGTDADSIFSTIRFREMGSAAELEYPLVRDEQIAAIVLGGDSFPVFPADSMNKADVPIRISLNGDADLDDKGLIPFVDSFGSQWEMLGSTGDGTDADPDRVYWKMSIPNDDSNSDNSLYFRIRSGEQGIRADVAPMKQFTLKKGTVTFGYNSQGALTAYNTKQPEELIIRYPQEPIQPRIFFVAEEAMVTEQESMFKGKLKKSREFDEGNAIVIGGPCVNRVANKLLNRGLLFSNYDCTSGFMPQQAKIELIEHNGTISLLIAGYGANETKLAADVFNLRLDELDGRLVIITGTDAETAEIAVRE